jgi:hypothetical protein
MGRRLPLQGIQPIGAKLKPTSLISPMYGVDMMVGVLEV